jgi:hypothetical protein
VSGDMRKVREAPEIDDSNGVYQRCVFRKLIIECNKLLHSLLED